MEPNIMLSLLSEVHFWTLRDDICIPNSDLGAFRYHEKKSHDDSVFCEGKKIYVERRAQTWVPPNKRPVRLKDNLKELEEHLSQQRLVLCQWRDSSLLQLMFSSGLFVNISINVFTGDLLSITFDKYLVGKLLSDYVADVVLTKSHIICSYNDSHLTMVYLSKPTLKRTHPKSFSRLDPRVHTIDLAGPSGRRLERKLVGNVSGDMFVVWWHSSHDEVYPWSPVVKDQDRANVLVYGISGIKADLLCHHRSEFDLLSISFSQVHSNVVRAVEQKVSRNGDVTVESSSYQISKGSMQKNSAASIILPTHVCCHGYSPLQDKLLLGCIDGSLVLYDDALGVTHTVRATFIPSTVSWHPDGGIFIIGNERCQFQILDVALATLKQQLLSEDITPSNLLDITPYFRFQPNLRFMKWSKKSENSFYGEKFVSSDSLLLLLFDRGPFAVLRFVGGGGLIGDIHGSGGFSVDSIVAQYLWANQVDKAINLLLSMNWDIAGNKSLSCLQRIVNYLFKLPLTPDREVQIQTVLGCFHMPVRPMCPATIDEFKAPLRDLTRRFFHQLLRHRLYEKAFRLAIDLMDRDLFMDIHYSAKKFGEIEIAEAAFKKAEDIDSGSYVSSVSGSSNSKCSRSSCSDCSESTSMVSDSENEPTVERNEYYSQQNSSTKKEITSRIILPYGLSPPSESRPSSTFTHPPLPILPQIVPGISGSSSTTNQEMNIDKSIFHGTRSLRENVSSSTHNRGIQACNQRVENDSLLITCEKDLPVLSMLNAPTVQHERPKVKFCGSVKQVTLCHDRLHTLPEEEEDTQLAIPLSSTGVASTKQTFHASGIENQSLMAAQSLLSSFTLSANSVGIPIVPHTLPGVGFPDRRNIDSNGRPLSSHFLPKPQSISANSYSAGSSYLPWMVDHGQMIGPPSQAAITPTLPPPCTNTLKSFQHNSVMCDVGELNHEKHNQKWKAIDLDDPLGSKELSALLPGSRKPLASSINFYEKNLNSHTLGNQSQGAESPESNYLNMYNGGKNGEEERHFLASSSLAPHENVSSLLDLSEEEENNGSIKIVHFGVV